MVQIVNQLGVKNRCKVIDIGDGVPPPPPPPNNLFSKLVISVSRYLFQKKGT